MCPISTPAPRGGERLNGAAGPATELGAESESGFDMIVVGSGPAGASAALELGRCRRRVQIDGGPGRNVSSRAAHGLYTRDGTSPAELRRVSQEQPGRYGVQTVAGQAVSARPVEGDFEGGFEVTLEDGQTFRAVKLVLTYGVRDLLPEVPGLAERWGEGVLHCPTATAGSTVTTGRWDTAAEMPRTTWPSRSSRGRAKSRC